MLDGAHRAAPGPEVLRGERAVRGLADVVVDVLRADLAALAVVVEVLEQVLARQVLRPLDDPGDPAVGDLQHPLLPRLALEAEAKARPLDPDVPVAEGRQAEAAVVAGVGGVADADQGGVEQPDDAGDDLVAREAAAGEVALDRAAQLRQRPGEVEEVRVFDLVPAGGPAFVIAVLLAAADVLAGGLQVAVGVGGDPDVLPGRRDDQRRDPVEDGSVGDAAAVRPMVGETAAGAPSPDAGIGIAAVDQRHVARGLVRVEREAWRCIHGATNGKRCLKVPPAGHSIRG